MRQVVEETGYPVSQVCRVLGMAESTYYRQGRHDGAAEKKPQELGKRPIMDETLARRIKRVLKAHPEFGYRRAWAWLRFREGVKVNRKTVQRIMQLKGWQCRRGWAPPDRKRAPSGKVSVEAPDTRWGIDLTKIYCGQDGWCPLIPIVDCCTRECVGFRFDRHGRAMEAADALDMAVTEQFGGPHSVPKGLEVRSDNGCQFLARHFVAEARRLGIEREYTPPRMPESNGICERFIRTLKEECVWLYNFGSFEEAEAVITAWIHHYNRERMHSALAYLSPAEHRRTLRKRAA